MWQCVLRAFSRIRNFLNVDNFLFLLLTLPGWILKAFNMTSMRLSDYSDGPEALESLLSWPMGSFQVHSRAIFQQPLYIDLRIVKDMLLKHRGTLKEFGISYLSQGTGVTSNHWHEFPASKDLTLSRWAIDPTRQSPFEPSPDALGCILTPWLKKFALEFRIEDQHQTRLSDFGEAEEAWVRWLVEAAIKRKWSLKEIRLKFYPDWWSPKKVS